MRRATLTVTAVAVLAFLVGISASSTGQAPDEAAKTLQAQCDAGGNDRPEACYRLALLYHDARGLVRDAGRARQLAARACGPNARYQVSYQACFTAFLWGEETWPLLGNPREMWVLVREILQAPNLERRKQFVATSRDLTALRELLDPPYEEIKAIPEYSLLKEAIRTRVAEIARSDPDWAKRRFCVADMTLSAALPSALRREMASNDPHPDVRAAAAKFLAQASAPLRDAAAMAERARNAPDPEARRMALPWIEDRATLAKIAEKDLDPEVRSAAVDRLASLSTPETRAETEAVLLRIAEKDKDNGVRLTAASGLKDERALARLAQKSPLPEVRAHAVETINDQAVIGWVAERDSDYETRGGDPPRNGPGSAASDRDFEGAGPAGSARGVGGGASDGGVAAAGPAAPRGAGDDREGEADLRGRDRCDDGPGPALGSGSPAARGGGGAAGSGTSDRPFGAPGVSEESARLDGAAECGCSDHGSGPGSGGGDRGCGADRSSDGGDQAERPGPPSPDRSDRQGGHGPLGGRLSPDGPKAAAGAGADNAPPGREVHSCQGESR